ncbi:ExeM/NucH family extracellular endonuclease [Nocardioides ultimimeridianus]
MRLSARSIAVFLAPVLSIVGVAALAPSASANAAGTGLVINEVSVSSSYTNKFVELYNPTSSAIDVSGYSLQGFAASATGGSNSFVDLVGSVPAHGSYLIQGATISGGTGALPTPDVASTGVGFGGTAGRIYLLNVSPKVATAGAVVPSTVVDLVGYGTQTNNSWEGSDVAPAPTSPKSISRNASHADTDDNKADFTLGSPTPTNSGPVAPAPLVLTNPGDQNAQAGVATTISLASKASGGTAPYTWGATGLDASGLGLSLNTSTGTISGTPATAGTYPVTVTLDDSAASTQQTASFNIVVAAAATVTPIHVLQGTSGRSTYAPASGTGLGTQVVSAEGVVTAVYTKGFNASGTATCGFCGYVIQDPSGDLTDNASDAIFVYGGAGFTGKDSTGTDLAPGQSVRVTGRISEFGGATDTETLTELNQSAAPDPIASLGTITPQATAPTTYDAREAHEEELFAPTDLVITDHYNFEGFGELGIATGNAVLQQPGQICHDGDTACIAAAQTDIKNRGYFMEDGTNTTFLSTAQHYRPQDSKNSDIPLPFIDKTHSARVGAQLTFPQGAVLHFANKKWYLDPPRAVLATHNAAAPDLGTDVVHIQDTRADNLAPRPAPAGANMRFATYNVENFFSVPMADYAAANPWYASSGKGCEYDYDRDGNGILAYQCTNPTGMATAWDPVTGAVTAYAPGLANAPRGAGRQEDLTRQTNKIVTAINKLGADVVALEEIGNPNKLKMGVTNSPLNPDLSNTKDQGQGSAIEWRDETLSYLVDHLNAALPAGADQWAFAASPEETTDSTSVPGLCSKVQPNGTAVPGPANLAGTCSYASGQDVIRSAFIYKVSKVVPVGPGDLDLPGYTVNGTPDPWGNHVFSPAASPFDNAREPFAQYFKPVGAANDEGFALIVNHFKSKGDADAPAGPATGGDANDPLHGAFNATRVAQSKELIRFANDFASKHHTDKVFLLGDFNAYSGEDPITTIEDADNTVDPLDFKEIHSDDPKDTSYVFTTTVDGVGYGGAGSLDHIFASAGARGLSPRTDIWEINANEPDIYDYGRYNTNKTDFFDGTAPWRGSDHNPEVVDLDLPSAAAPPKVTDVQIVGMNDFHGRLIADASDGGASPLASGVASLRRIYGADHTVFVSAGDNVGASIFESFTQKDKPTLDALNAMDLQVSSVGNHEFDHGVSDLLDRIEKPKSASNPYGADDPLTWGDYLAANVVWSTTADGHTAGDPITAPTKMISVPNALSGTPIKIGFIGAVTSDLPSLQSPANLAGVSVLDTADTVSKINDYATQLKSQGANLVILLDHEGAATTDCSTMQSAGTAFSSVINGISADVDAVLSGHTHLEYSCSFGKAATASNPLTTRPVMQAASYGTALDQLVYSFDASNIPVDLIQDNVGIKGPGGALFDYGKNATVQPIVNQAIADSQAAGSQVLGKMSAPMYRSKLSDGTDNRGGESVLGNQIAEIQRWATADPQHGGAQIAFMNPGGLRADALGNPDGGAYDLTYRQAADVQPFANELVNLKLTGAQIKKVLEEQWQRDASGNIPARPFLKLGTSLGFTYTYTEAQDPAKPAGAMLGTVTGMWLDGQPIDPAATYSVTVNSFLSTGGDNFWELNNGASKQDTELTDLQAQVDYMQQYATTPLQVDSSQHGIRVTFPDGAPADYAPGDTVTLDLASLDLNAPAAVQDDTVSIKVGGTVVASGITVTHGNGTTPDDHWGTAHVSFVVPADAPRTARVHVVGAATGTDVTLPVSLRGLPALTTATPTIDNTSPRAGDVLTATPGTWGPGTVAFSYQWLADGTPIDGATAATYAVGTSEVGKKITVAVTGTEDGYESSTVTSAETAAVTPALQDIQIIGTNDFHGRILADGSNAGGAAVLAGAVEYYRNQNPNTVFAAAGDLIGASTFESFIQHDEPTIDALNAAGLDVSSVGNHEFDQGYDDLMGRVQDRAHWKYIGANVQGPAGGPQLAKTWTKTMNGVKVGFVGAVTEDLPSLVSPAGMQGVTVSDIVDATNSAATQLKADGADLVILLVHEGSSSTDCTSPQFTDPSTVWGNIVQNTSPDVDAIISGHTHLKYNCSYPVSAWSGRPVTDRPVVSAGQYGTFLDKLDFTVDPATGQVMAKSQSNVNLTGSGVPGTPDPAVQAIVDAAQQQAAVLGAKELGTLGGPFDRAKFASGSENRGGESTLGNMVAEVQRAQTPDNVGGAAQIAFMNPGGLRADLVGTVVDQAYLDAHPDSTAAIGDRIVTYKQAATVQPFANTLVNMNLTGAQLKTVLEQQWQRTAVGGVPTRAFLKLGISKGFSYTYTQAQDPAQAAGVMKGTVTGMWLDGVAIDPSATYSVTVNSFLASGGDNFRELANGAAKKDTGVTDLQAMVDYLAGLNGAALPVAFQQQGVGVAFPADAPSQYGPLDHVRFSLSSLSMTGQAAGGPNDTTDTSVTVMLGGTSLGSFPVTTTVSSSADGSANSNDEAGTASVDVVLPATVGADPTLTVIGDTTSTTVRVPIHVVPVTPVATVTGTDTTQVYGEAGSMSVTVGGNLGTPTGTVTLTSGDVQLGSAPVGSDGTATVPIAARSLAVSGTPYPVTVSYGGDATYAVTTGTASLTVSPATATVTGADVTQESGQTATMQVTVAGTLGAGTPTGTVSLASGSVALGSATLGPDGTATVTIPVNDLAAGSTAYPVTISYSGDGAYAAASGSGSLTVTAAPPARATPTVTGTPATQRYGRTGSMKVTVTAAGVTPTGTVALSSGGVQLGQGTLGADGTVVVSLAAKALKPRATPYPVTITYSGDASVLNGTGTAALTVTKGSVKVTAKASTSHVVVKRTKVGIVVTVVNADRVAATGKVTVSGAGIAKVSGTLSRGRATLHLKPFGTTGAKRLTVTYAGSTYLLGGRATITIRVVKK